MRMGGRVTLAIVAALLVWGWGPIRNEVVRVIALGTGASTGEVSTIVTITMAIGIGCVVFAALRPTNRKDE